MPTNFPKFMNRVLTGAQSLLDGASIGRSSRPPPMRPAATPSSRDMPRDLPGLPPPRLARTGQPGSLPPRTTLPMFAASPGSPRLGIPPAAKPPGAQTIASLDTRFSTTGQTPAHPPRRKLSVAELGKALSGHIDPRDLISGKVSMDRVRPPILGSGTAAAGLLTANAPLQASRAELRPPPRRRASTGTPLYQSVRSESVPDDGNCFMHSLVRLAGPQLSRKVALLSGAELTSSAVRGHMTSHLIDQFNALNDNTARKDAAANERLLDEAPYLIHLHEADTPLDFRDPEVQAAFASAVGLHQLGKCMALSDAQKTHVLHMALDKSWHSQSSDLLISSFDSQVGDVMPSIAVSAFPGLRLNVITHATTPENQAVHGQGHEPVVMLLLDGKHYEPIVSVDSPP